MKGNILYTTCRNDFDLQQILDLQAKNLRHMHSAEVEKDQGFVTVHHSLEVLQAMNEEAKHIIAIDNEHVVGYALAMTRSFKDRIPELVAMFDMLDSLKYKGKSLSDFRYLVMGQICVDASHRGQGVFDGMYNHYFQTYRGEYEVVITEVALRNTRSLRAHERVGFEPLHTYHEAGSEDWVVIGYTL
jgi:GNAT superfamily N-acetyltransferase